MQTTLEIQPYPFAASWLIGPSSYLMDRYLKQVELIRWPAWTYDGGQLTIIRAEAPAERRRAFSRRERLRHIVGRGRRDPVDLGNAPAIDLRHEPYFNWSHQLNQYVPQALLCRDLAAPGEEVTIVLHEAMPAQIADLYRHLGFAVLMSDGAVTACFIDIRIADGNVWNSHAYRAVAPHLDRFAAAALGVGGDRPRKLYLARRGTRAILNGKEIEAMLAARGFTTIHCEDLTGREQIALIGEATDIVAIHGAALAPLLFRRPGAELRLVELLPVGHMTHFYRMMCDQVGGSYVGVRGRLRAGYVPAIYGDAPFLDHSLDPFEIDPESLAVALRIAAGEDVPGDLRAR